MRRSELQLPEILWQAPASFRGAESAPHRSMAGTTLRVPARGDRRIGAAALFAAAGA